MLASRMLSHQNLCTSESSIKIKVTSESDIIIYGHQKVVEINTTSESSFKVYLKLCTYKVSLKIFVASISSI